jgi:hypothetical protein
MRRPPLKAREIGVCITNAFAPPSVANTTPEQNESLPCDKLLYRILREHLHHWHTGLFGGIRVQFKRNTFPTGPAIGRTSIIFAPGVAAMSNGELTGSPCVHRERSFPVV